MIPLLAQVATCLAHVEFPVGQMNVAIVPTVSTGSSKPYANVSIDLSDDRDVADRFMSSFHGARFYRDPEPRTYAMYAEFDTPFAKVGVHVYVGEDYFREEATR